MQTRISLDYTSNHKWLRMMKEFTFVMVVLNYI